MADFTEMLSGFVRKVMARVDFYGSYSARVVAQNADGTLELVPDDSRFPGLSGVPIRYGVPGVKATVAPGARVLLGFAGGNPSRPQAELWESASVTKLEITAGAVDVGGGTMQAAALGDTLAQALADLKTAITTHVHAVSGAVTTTVTVATPPTFVAQFPPDVTSSTVKVKA